jgi:hypothetical protein
MCGERSYLPQRTERSVYAASIEIVTASRAALASRPRICSSGRRHIRRINSKSREGSSPEGRRRPLPPETEELALGGRSFLPGGQVEPGRAQSGSPNGKSPPRWTLPSDPAPITLATMPLQWTISHPLRLVVAVAKGDIRPESIIDFLAVIDAEYVRPYGKIFGVSDLLTIFTEEDVRNLANLVRKREQESRVGPIAVVATDRRSFRQAQLFAEVAKIVRPIQVFREWHEARRWIEGELQNEEQPKPAAVAAS